MLGMLGGGAGGGGGNLELRAVESPHTYTHTYTHRPSHLPSCIYYRPLYLPS